MFNQFLFCILGCTLCMSRHSLKIIKDRSRMNICFVMAPEYKDFEADFLKFATERGMVGIKGHRSVGGFRASCYNALPKESVQALIDCMQEFEKLH